MDGTMDQTRDSVLRVLSETYRLRMARIMAEQAGVPSAFDTVLIAALKQIRAEQLSGRGGTPDARKRLQLFQQYSQFQNRERLVPYSVRARETALWNRFPWEPSPYHIVASQGVDQCISWKDRALLKSVFDFAIYPMLLYELKPFTIIEMGSGTGASALWLAEMLRAHQITGRIYSIDLQQLEPADPDVIFMQGDGREIDAVCSPAFLQSLPHPWLIIEDMHVNTIGVLRYFTPHMSVGDYIIIEDSTSKKDELATFDSESGSAFRVDSRYTDFFGRNATCSPDSILVKVP
jgi:hypothetical protein